MNIVYFDNAATTRLRDEVIETMARVLRSSYGNPSSTHSVGRDAKALIEQSRKHIASFFNVSSSEICFTSGGTEADNLILRSAVRDLGVKTIITSKIEHHAVLHTAEKLSEEFDIALKFVNINADSSIDLSHLESLLKEQNNTLVSLMHINNEIGTVLDIKTIAELCKTHSALFHSDTVQSVGHYVMDLQTIPIDFMVASAHKFHGPKGVGFAFIRKNSGLKSLIIGGEQERGLRAGTESLHNIVGLDKALELSYKNLETEKKQIQSLKQYFIDQLRVHIPNIAFNGLSDDMEKSTYTLVNLRLPISPDKAAMLQFQLDLKGIACSKGSACQSGSSQKSHVLSEILDDNELNKPSVRFSFSCFNTKEEVDYVVEVLKEFL